MCPVSCHCIGRCNSTQSNWMFVCTLIAHNTYATNCREQYCTSLPNLIVERNLNLAIVHVGRNTGCKYTACVLTAKQEYERQDLDQGKDDE